MKPDVQFSFDDLRRLPAPLESGLALGRGDDFLIGLVERFGAAPSAAALDRLDDAARNLTDRERVMERLASIATPAAQWLAAAILEQSGRVASAAEKFDAIVLGWGEAQAAGKLAVARNRLAAGEPQASWIPLYSAAQQARSSRTRTRIDRVLQQLRKQAEEPASFPVKRKLRVALLGSSTLNFHAPVLRAAAFASGIALDLHVGGFGQYRQEILGPDAKLEEFRPEVVILATDWRSLALGEETDDPRAAAGVAEGLRGLWQECRRRWNAFVIQHNFEVPPEDPYGRLSSVLPGGRARVIREINAALWDAERAASGVAVLDIEQAAAAAGKKIWNDAALWHTAKQYPSAAALPELARRQSAVLAAVAGLSAKCLVLDLDGVLWGGVIGEDGMDGIALGGTPTGESFVAFQRYVRALPKRGIPLAVCSKNNDTDARQVFTDHPEMVLKIEDIAVFVANWEPKEENLRRIAGELNIGLDSLVFVDDNPAERERIRRALPEVRVPEMPADPALYISALDDLMAFESLTLTDEDRARAASYRENLERKQLETAAGSLDGFLASLAMEAELLPFTPANLPRITQLINKTNQFNLTTTRMTDAEVAAIAARSDCYTQSMRLRDRFGDNGLTGVLIGVMEGDALRISSWLISCRVLGRRVEELMLSSAIAGARRLGAKWVIGEYRPTAKNAQVRDVYARMGWEAMETSPHGRATYRWDVCREFPAPECFRVNDETAAIGAFKGA